MPDPDPIDDRLAGACKRWALSELVRVADTATSRVFRVCTSTSELACLKLLKPYGADEIAGARFMAWRHGDGAAKILATAEDMILMEWLDGDLLGDKVRKGNDGGATEILCEVARKLHQPRGGQPDGLKPLETRFQALFDADPASWPAATPLFARAQTLARHLFASCTVNIPLHGDFHHDNVMSSARGWLAFDPKGLIGDPAYDFANCFRNPYGAEDLTLAPARIQAMATHISRTLGHDRQRLLSWAAAHCALSECWNRESGLEADFNLKLLPLLFAELDAG